MTDFIAKKREMFLVQMALDTKRAEILKLDDRLGGSMGPRWRKAVHGTAEPLKLLMLLQRLEDSIPAERMDRGYLLSRADAQRQTKSVLLAMRDESEVEPWRVCVRVRACARARV